jgi:hypothetical protein
MADPPLGCSRNAVTEGMEEGVAGGSTCSEFQPVEPPSRLGLGGVSLMTIILGSTGTSTRTEGRI